MPHSRDVFLGPTHHSNNNNINLITAGQINLLSADQPSNSIDTGIQLWQTHSSSASFFQPGSAAAAGVLSCQDCGNQAKKDCTHRRCRTCCKSRGFDCSTHVKSTWVPAARRRERQLMNIAAGSSASTSAAASKKPRLINIPSQTTTTSHTSTSNTPPRSFETTSSHHHQEGGLKESTMPGQVRATAVFKCVRVTAVDDGEDEYAYQAVVKIGGHIFKGFLYDQGAETRDGFPNMSDLHLGPGIDPPSSSDVYATAAAVGGLLGGGLGSAYGNQIN